MTSPIRQVVAEPDAPQNDRQKLTKTSRFRIGLRILGILCCIFAGAALLKPYLPPMESVKVALETIRIQLGLAGLLAAVFVYAGLLTIPFIPAVELGLLIMLCFGKDAIPFLYVGTLVGLGAAFWLGRKLPTTWIRFVYRGKAAGDKNQTVISSDNIISLVNKLPSRGLFRQAKNLLIRQPRAFLIIFLLNVPLNFVAGGGSGIAILCGMDRRYPWREFLATIAIASLPIPLLCYFGLIQVERYLHLGS